VQICCCKLVSSSPRPIYIYIYIYIYIFADDVLLSAPFIDSLQKPVNLCEAELSALDLAINVKKSVCTRVGPPCNVLCSNVTTVDGDVVQWIDTVRYTWVHLLFVLDHSSVVSTTPNKLFIEPSTLYMVK